MIEEISKEIDGVENPLDIKNQAHCWELGCSVCEPELKQKVYQVGAFERAIISKKDNANRCKQMSRGQD